MSIAKMKWTVGIALALGSFSTAQAGFVAVNNAFSAAPLTIDIVNQNEFKTALAQPAFGITQYTLGASLGVDVAGTVTYYYYGKEAGYQNIFYTGGGQSYNTGFAPSLQNNLFGAPKLIGSVDVGAGVLGFSFCAFSSPGASVGCVSNALNDWLTLGSFQSIAFNATSDVAWIFWDDSGAGPDDNHDDMLIKAVFSPRSVPEPATLGLFGLGLLGTWVAARRRKLVRSAV